MDGPRRPLRAMAALLGAVPALAACSAAGGGAGAPLPYVAEFRLGGDTSAARQFVLTPTPGPRVEVLPEPRVEVLPEPSPGPPITPSPDRGEPLPTGPRQTLPVTPPEAGTSFEPSVAWVDDGRYLGVVTYGSSSCPSGPHGIEVIGDQEVEIRLGPMSTDRDVCSADLSGHVTVVELPDGLRPTKPLTAHFGERQVAIPAVGD